MPRSPIAQRAMLGLGVAGLLVSLVMLYIHYQLAATSGGYTSFCNVNQQVNCDTVLGSEYAYFLGVPVAAWAAATYATVVVLSSMSGASAVMALAVLAGSSIGYSVFLAYVSLAVLGTVCLLCIGLYVVNLGLAALAWMRLSRVSSGRTTALAMLGSLSLAIVAAAAGTGEDGVGSGPDDLPREFQGAGDSRFYDWYVAQPRVRGAADGGHARGPASAPVTIVEFSDFACTHCARAHRALKTLLARRPDDVRLVFRHFPLDTSCNPTLRKQVHPEACAAAMAAECAGEQGEFWPYHDYLFDHQGALDYEDVAAELGLDRAGFRDCMSRGTARSAVVRDIERGTQLGVASTPTTYINDRTIQGALAVPLYEHAVAIEKARADRGRRPVQ
jgi:protein-disulfide isomerase/uncharacterized membrane protein